MRERRKRMITTDRERERGEDRNIERGRGKIGQSKECKKEMMTEKGKRGIESDD